MYCSKPSKYHQKKGIQLIRQLIQQTQNNRSIQNQNNTQANVSLENTIKLDISSIQNALKYSSNNINKQIQTNTNKLLQLQSNSLNFKQKQQYPKKNQNVLQSHNPQTDLQPIKNKQAKQAEKPILATVKSYKNNDISASFNKKTKRQNIKTEYSQKNIKNQLAISLSNSFINSQEKRTKYTEIKQKLSKNLQTKKNLLKKQTPRPNIQSHSFLKFQFSNQKRNIQKLDRELILERDIKNKLKVKDFSKKQDLSTSKQKKFASTRQNISKQRKIFQKVKLLQKVVQAEKQKIKKTRKDFVDLLQAGKIKIIFLQKEGSRYTQKIDFIEKIFQIKELQKLKRWQKKQSLLYKIQNLTKLNIQQETSFQQFFSTIQGQIDKKIAQNSSISRKIYHLKHQIQKHQQSKQTWINKEQFNKSSVKFIIEKQECINSLNMQKNIKIHKTKQELKQNIKDLIQQEDKYKIYQKLDKELNLIKEYYKISDNSRQFKRNIKKMTNYDSYNKEIDKFQKSPDFNSEIMSIYKKNLWSTQFPKFLQNQPLVLESSKIRQIKLISKGLDSKKSILYQSIKQKEKTISALTLKRNKLQEQIKKMSKQFQQSYQVSQSQVINWGF